MAERARPNIVSVQLSPQGKAKLDKACADRGMTIKSLLGRLIGWFVTLDRTEQSIVLGQLEEADVTSVAGLIQRRSAKKGGAAARRGAERA
ncbi:MAG TPA: hypothetical protein VM487_13215 [Phycisphaerae bacterium]|nr:hypothetical protein [Phycisphaerae bacterium]